MGEDEKLKQFFNCKCDNCGTLGSPYEYWFQKGQEKWAKKMCDNCKNDMINKMQELKKKIKGINNERS